MANSHTRTGINKNCKVCNTIFYAAPWEMKRRKGKIFCSKLCAYKGRECTMLFQKGHKDLVPKEKRGHTEESKMKISKIQREKNKFRVPNLLKIQKRDFKKKIRQSFQWKDWRGAIFKRDNWTCKECGVKGVYLEPHHIIPLRSDVNKLFDINNGITLCRPCHRKTIWKESDFVEKYSALVAAQL